jgi:hypothetical protein
MAGPKRSEGNAVTSDLRSSGPGPRSHARIGSDSTFINVMVIALFLALGGAASAQPATPQASALPAGGYTVQVSAQRSEADARASYRSLQQKYPSVLRARDPIIRRTDQGEKGVWYKAQLGPFTTVEQAIAFCDSLKAAGGQCVVQLD